MFFSYFFSYDMAYSGLNQRSSQANRLQDAKSATGV